MSVFQGYSVECVYLFMSNICWTSGVNILWTLIRVVTLLISLGAPLLRSCPCVWGPHWADSQWGKGATCSLPGFDLRPHPPPLEHWGPSGHQDLSQPPYDGHEVHILWWEVSISSVREYYMLKELNVDCLISLPWEPFFGDCCWSQYYYGHTEPPSV